MASLADSSLQQIRKEGKNLGNEKSRERDTHIHKSPNPSLRGTRGREGRAVALLFFSSFSINKTHTQESKEREMLTTPTNPDATSFRAPYSSISAWLSPLLLFWNKKKKKKKKRSKSQSASRRKKCTHTRVFAESRDDGQDTRQVVVSIRHGDRTERLQNHSRHQFPVEAEIKTKTKQNDVSLATCHTQKEQQQFPSFFGRPTNWNPILTSWRRDAN